MDIQPIDFSFSGTLEYNNNKYDYQHASTINDLYQNLINKFNQDYQKYQLKMPPQSFFVARGKRKKEISSRKLHEFFFIRYLSKRSRSCLDCITLL